MDQPIQPVFPPTHIFFFLKAAPHVDMPAKAIPWIAKRLKVSQHNLKLLMFQYKHGIRYGEN